MSERIYLNKDWQFTEDYAKGFDNAVNVDLPHTVKQTPYNYFDEHIYQMECGYRRTLKVPAVWKGRRITLTIGAAGHSSYLYINGKQISEHHCGYTAFCTDLSSHLKYGKDNIIEIRVDSREQQNIPPFGYVIDYMTYGGLYREVWLEITDIAHIESLFIIPDVPDDIVYTEDLTFTGTVRSRLLLALTDDPENYQIRQTICLRGLEEILASEVRSCRPSALAGTESVFKTSEIMSVIVDKASLWDVESPQLYTLHTSLIDKDGKILDEREDNFGFRKARFEADGFHLNGRILKIRGLNRHQSFPYVGYAMPRSMQEFDADILKNELGLNAVRTSHYPQSHYFIDRCDEIGLLVFTEIPGWQHIGDDSWKDQVLQNVKDMIEQYRNHPSIILWGVRINESLDDDRLYMKTNDLAHKLDPTRQTGGVRYLKKSHLLEDVYTYNDFLHNGSNAGCDPKAHVTSDRTKPYLISEYNGHMFPTKTIDDEPHRLEHALRHANVLDAVGAQDDICGSFGWCFTDYNTHKDFGSGDRICYHGVMDMFRNPKLAACVYASQQDDHPVLEIGSEMNVGDHPAGSLGEIYIFTNADSVRMYKNDVLLKEYFESDSKYDHMRHGPILIDDYIGDRLITGEGYSQKQSDAVKYILNYAALYGFEKLPVNVMKKAAGLMTRYRMNFSDAYQLYGKYISGWGDSSSVYRFEAVKDGEIVRTVIKTPFEKVCLHADVSHTDLVEDNTYDVAAVRLRVTDENGNLLSYYNECLNLKVRGPIAVIGPKNQMIRGGFGGVYVRSCGEEGKAILTIKTENTEDIKISFNLTCRQ